MASHEATRAGRAQAGPRESRGYAGISTIAPDCAVCNGASGRQGLVGHAGEFGSSKGNEDLDTFLNRRQT